MVQTSFFTFMYVFLCIFYCKVFEFLKYLLKAVLLLFPDRDTGFEMADDDIICSVMAFMTEDDDDDFDDYGFGDDSDDDEDYGGGSGLLLAMRLAQALG